MILKRSGRYFLILFIFLQISVSLANDYGLSNLSSQNIVFQKDLLKRSSGTRDLFKRSSISTSRSAVNSTNVESAEPDKTSVIPIVSNSTTSNSTDSSSNPTPDVHIKDVILSDTDIGTANSTSNSTTEIDSGDGTDIDSGADTEIDSGDGTDIDSGADSNLNVTVVLKDEETPTSGDELDDCLKTKNCTKDNHQYYNVTYVNTNALWIEIHPGNGGDGAKHLNASTNFRYGYSIPLKMNFLYYGLPLKNVTITTGGFIYTGTVRHPKLTVTQYIAPFMGEFDPSASAYSNVYYHSNESMFIVQWDNLTLSKANNHTPDVGSFTFQVQLHTDNSIIFAYKTLPLKSLNETDHSNNVGVSDAYYMFSISNIYVKEYHQIKLKKEKLGNNTGVLLTALPTCSTIKDCYNCSTGNIGFECMWCEQLKSCSDNGKDRAKSDWIQNRCSINQVSKGGKCSDYCYKPDTSPHTNYSSTDAVYPINSTVEISCDCTNFSLPANVKVSDKGEYQCSVGGIELPVCQKICTYTQAPQHGWLKGTTVGKTLKPGSTWSVICKDGHSVRNTANRVVVCNDGGQLEPDPKNIKCERFCTLPFLHKSKYMPDKKIEKFKLHEGDNVTVKCLRNYVLPVGAPSVITCSEAFDNSTISDCVGYCTLPTPPNNTFYSALKPYVGCISNITCSPNWVSATKFFNCTLPGRVKKPPVCVNRHQGNHTEKNVPSPHSNVFIILLVLFLLTMISVVAGWIFYAYRNPTTPSGLFLIEKCRPWTWRSSYSRQPTNLGESYYMDGDI